MELYDCMVPIEDSREAAVLYVLLKVALVGCRIARPPQTAGSMLKVRTVAAQYDHVGNIY